MSLAAVPLHSGPFTKADREAVQDNGRRVELIDGALVMSPSPGRDHNLLLEHIHELLRTARPAGVVVWGHAYDVTLPDGSTLVPDIVVARREDLGEKEMTRVPLLVVEVLSESSRLSDPTVKRVKYEQLGVPAYWIGDPVGPTLTVLELVGRTYHTAAVLPGGGSTRVERPFPCELYLPSQL